MMHFKTLLGVALTAALAACGGAGPDSVETPGNTPPPVAGNCPAPGAKTLLLEMSGTAPTAAEGVPVPPGEHQEFTVTVPSGCPLETLAVSITWDQDAEDLDLEVYGPDGELASSSGSFNALDGAGELATVGNPAPGDYLIRVISYLNVETPFTGEATITAAPGALPLADLSDVPAGPAPRVVVAVIDSGINTYHQFYHAGGPNYVDNPPSAVTRDVLDEFDIGPECVIELTRTGDFAADFAADTASGQWTKANICDVVWFKGTNVLAKSVNAGSLPVLPDDEGDTHGVGTSAAVLNANPEAIVLFLEGISDPAEIFAFSHPAVDFITTSYGPIGSAPLPGNLTDSFHGTYVNGKLHFGACDNTPALASVDSTCGPWWSVGIAGFEETAENEPASSSEGVQSVSGNLPDFRADFTQTLPYCMACEDGYSDGVGGTSFATPRSAGTASKILLTARRAAGHMRGIRMGAGAPDDPPVMVDGDIRFTNWELRRALEEAAWVPEFGNYDPVAGVTEFGPGYPVPPVAPWTAIGWGILSVRADTGVVERTLDHLGVTDGEPVTKDAGFCEHQTAVIEGRKVYWDFLDSESETFMNAPSPDPFLYCGG